MSSLTLTLTLPLTRSLEGTDGKGLRCWVCDEVSERDEDPKRRPDVTKDRAHMLHKTFYAQWGPKDHKTYLGWLEKMQSLFGPKID